MKRLIFLMPATAAIFVLLLAGCNKSSLDTSLFTVEVIDDVRLVHNHAPQLGETPDVKLELLGKIGKLEGVEQKDILYDPVDAARLSNGDILILEGSGCTIKRYNKDHEFVSSFGQRGQGPGDFLSPYFLRLNKDRNKVYVADSRISEFSLDGSFQDSFKPTVIAAFGSIGVQYKTSGMAVLSGSFVILPSHPSNWMDSGDHKLLSVYDKTGAIIRSFGAVKLYDDQELSLNANIVNFTKDSSENIYLAYAHQNRISKYSSEGEMIFSSDRSLPYEIENVIKVELFKSGNMEREFPWPSVTSVSKGIGIDARGRLWVLTFLKQPNKFGEFENEGNLSKCYEFDVFDPNGVLLFKIPFPNVLFDNFSIYDDRIYLIDFQNESCVYEYRIVEKN
ncbi:MAG: hypothetical protein MUP70_10435 [Candidatus Aminicenantes bacterium]|nr:hypothetical protein [Candidatus Aminicenantes bacterium]